jgi:DNA-binding XRE family transcriptional regulator
MGNEKVSLTIEIKKETYLKIQEICEFENLKNKIKKRNRDFASPEDIVKGAIIKELERIEKYNLVKETIGLNDLGKPFKIKNRFKEIIKVKGIKQNDLAKLTGIDKGNLSLILNNKNQPSLDYYLRIWIALDCPSIEKVLYRNE